MKPNYLKYIVEQIHTTMVATVNDAGWYRAKNCYEDFLRRHENLKVVYLELGVGGNTPVIIKYPFWRMTDRNPNATYVFIGRCSLGINRI